MPDRKKLTQQFQLLMLFMLFAIAFPAPARAADRQGFVPVSADRALYVDYKEPKPGRPTLVMLNGLTQNTKTWGPFAEDFEKEGFGVLRVDLMGQGRTLERCGPGHDLNYKNQVADLSALLDAMGIKEKVDLVALSYGGGIALAFAAEHPDKVRNLFSQNGFVNAKDDVSFRQSLDTMTDYYPWLAPFRQAIYSTTVKSYLYWKFLAQKKDVNSNLREAAYRLAIGIRDFDAHNAVASLPRFFAYDGGTGRRCRRAGRVEKSLERCPSGKPRNLSRD